MNNIFWPHFQQLLKDANLKAKKRLLKDINPEVLAKAPQEVKDLHGALLSEKEKSEKRTERKRETLFALRERTKAKKEDKPSKKEKKEESSEESHSMDKNTESIN